MYNNYPAILSSVNMIRKLPSEVKSYLRSGVAVTTVTQVVEELLVNSLDAGASCVAARVDLDCYKVQIVDNGCGIPCDQLPLLGERYATSKCHTVSDLDDLRYFGYRGEAVASIREACSILEVTTRTKGSSTTYSRLFQQGRAMEPVESSIPRPSIGTTVTVYDLFSNFPVRRKCTNESLELERIRQRVQGLALLRPDVSISLRNDSTGAVLVQTHKSRSSLLTFTQLFGTARARSLVEVSGSLGQFAVEGYIGKEGHLRKELQFVYVNGRLVLKTKIHKQVNQSLARSTIFKRKYGNSDTSPAFSNKVSLTGSPTKQTDRYPVYVLNVKCPLMEYDITFDPGKTLVEFKDWDSLLKCMTNVIDTFLKCENLLANPDAAENKSENDAETETRNFIQNSDGNNYRSISPSNMRDTLVSKKAKLVTKPADIEETPHTITLEEWKANHMPKPKEHILETLAEESIIGDPTLDSDHSSESSDQGPKLATDIHSTIKTSNEKDILMTMLDERGDSSKSHTRDVESQCKYLDISNIKQRKEQTAVPSNDFVEPQSSLSEFKISIGKVNQPSKGAPNIETTLKARLSSNNFDKGQSVHSKVTSSLQRFRKHSATVFADDNYRPFSQHVSEVDNDLSEQCHDGDTAKVDCCRNETLDTRQRLDFENNTNNYNQVKMVRILENTNEKPDAHLGKSRFTSNLSTNRNAAIRQEYTANNSSLCGNLGRHPQFLSSISSVEATPDRLVYGSGDRPSTSTAYKHNADVHRSDTCMCKSVDKISMPSMLSKFVEHETEQLNRKCRKRPSNVETNYNSTAAKLSKLVVEKASSISISSEDSLHSLCRIKSTTSGDNVSTLELSDGNSSDTEPRQQNQMEFNFDNFLTHTGFNSISSDVQNPIALSGVQLLCKNSNAEVAVDSNLDSAVSTGYPSEPFVSHIEPIASPCAVMSQQDSSFASGINTCNTYQLGKVLNMDRVPEPTGNEVTVGDIHVSNVCDNVEFADYCTQSFLPQVASQTCHTRDIGAHVSQGFTPTHSPPIVCDNQFIDHEAASTCSGGFSPHLSDCQTGEGSTGVATSPAGSLGFSPLAGGKPVYRTSADNTISLDEDVETTPTNMPDSTESISIQMETLSTPDVSNDNIFVSESNNSDKIMKIDSSPAHLPDSDKHAQFGVPSTCTAESITHEADPLTNVSNVNSFKEGKSLGVGTSSETLDESDNVPSVTLTQLLRPTSSGERLHHTSSCHTPSQNTEDILHFSDIFSPTQNNSIPEKEITSDVPVKVMEFKNKQDTCPSFSNIELEADDTNSDKTTKKSQELTCMSNTEFLDQGIEQKSPFSEWNCSLENKIISVMACHQTQKEEESASMLTSDHGCEGSDNHNNNSFEMEQPCYSESNLSRVNETSFDTTFDSIDLSQSELQPTNQNAVKLLPNPQNVIEVCTQPEALDTSKKGNCKLVAESGPSVVSEKSNTYQKSSIVAGEHSTEPVGKWIQMTDPHTGKKMFVHSLLGTTVSNSQWLPTSTKSYDRADLVEAFQGVSSGCDDTTSVQLTPRSSEVLQDLVTAHLTSDDNDTQVKWRNKPTPTDAHSEQAEVTVEKMFQDWENPAFTNPDTEVVSVEMAGLPSRSSVTSYKAVHTCTFTKPMLNTVKVVGQVDNKFIACLLNTDEDNLAAAPNLLAVIDQHAAHERVRLEMLTEEVYEDSDVERGRLASVSVDPAKSLAITEEEIRVMEAYKEEFTRIGIRFTKAPGSRGMVMIQSVPSCVVEKEASEARRKRDTVVWKLVENLIQEHVELLLTTQGARGRLPKEIHRILCSQACHGAVKFGDSLTVREATLLVRDLARCDLPFQCAHGRPALMPVLQLSQLSTKLPPTQKLKKPRLYKLTAALDKPRPGLDCQVEPATAVNGVIE